MAVDAAFVGNMSAVAHLAQDGSAGTVKAPLEVAMLLHIALGETATQVVLRQVHFVGVGHTV